MSSKPPLKIPSELNMDSNDSNEGLPNNAVVPPIVHTNKCHQAEVSETESSTEDLMGNEEEPPAKWATLMADEDHWVKSCHLVCVI